MPHTWAACSTPLRSGSRPDLPPRSLFPKSRRRPRRSSGRTGRRRRAGRPGLSRPRSPRRSMAWPIRRARTRLCGPPPARRAPASRRRRRRSCWSSASWFHSFPRAHPIRATAEFVYGVHKHEARIRLALGCHNGGLVGAVGGHGDGEARLAKRPRVSRKLQPLVAAWPKRPSRTVASLFGHGPGFSASPSPDMGPTHYGEVSATHRGEISSVILPPAIHQSAWKVDSRKFGGTGPAPVRGIVSSLGVRKVRWG